MTKKSLTAKIVIVMSLVCFIPAQSIGAGNSDADSVKKLGLHLDSIEDQASTQRYMGGGTLLGLGVLSGVGAIVSNNSTDQAVFGIIGGSFAVIGTLVLIFPTDYEELPQTYRLLPEDDSSKLRAKLLTGETYLSRLSERAHNHRIAAGGALIAVGASEIIWFLASDNRALSDVRIYSGVLLAGFGILNFFTKHPAETEYENYQQWQGKSNALSSLRFGIAPSPNGLAAMAKLNF